MGAEEKSEILHKLSQMIWLLSIRTYANTVIETLGKFNLQKNHRTFISILNLLVSECDTHILPTMLW